MLPVARWPESVNVRQGEGRKEGGSAQDGEEAEVEGEAGDAGEGRGSARRKSPSEWKGMARLQLRGNQGIKFIASMFSVF